MSTYGERVVMALSEAGYPPSIPCVITAGVRRATWLAAPPLDIYLKACRLSGHPGEYDKWRHEEGLPLSLVLDDLTDAEMAEYCAANGFRNMRVSS